MAHPLVELARRTLVSHLNGGEIDSASPLPGGSPPQACFVSLKGRGGRLRGCIGTVLPTKGSVEEEVANNTVAAATKDPRFDPVRRNELGQLHISIDLLSLPEEVAGHDDLDPRRYGLIVRAGDRCGVLLPDLPGIDSVDQQEAICREKGRISPQEPVVMERFVVERHNE